MSRSNTLTLAALAAGLISSGLFLGAAASGLGFFFLFPCTLPLLMLGLRSHSSDCLIAGMIAAAAIALFASLDAAIIYWVYLALPSWYLGRQSLLCSQNNHETRWFPIGLLLLQLSLLGVVTIAAMTAYYASEPGGIPAIISAQITTEFQDAQAEMAAMLRQVAEHWAFLVFALTVWMWVMLLYAHVWIATRLLGRPANDRRLRKSVAIDPFIMPGWVISLMAIAALASLIGSESMQFLGRATLVCLMLPYFLLGSALMHESSKNWPSRRFFLFFVYFMILAQLWPALILCALGLFHHIKSLSGAAPSARS